MFLCHGVHPSPLSAPVSLYAGSVLFVQVQVLLSHRAHILKTMAAAKHPVVEHACMLGENKIEHCGLKDVRIYP